LACEGGGAGPSKSGAGHFILPPGHSKSRAGPSKSGAGHFILPPGHNDRVSYFKHFTKSAASQPPLRVNLDALKAH
jgi:hypothetical protein